MTTHGSSDPLRPRLAQADFLARLRAVALVRADAGGRGVTDEQAAADLARQTEALARTVQAQHATELAAKRHRDPAPADRDEGRYYLRSAASYLRSSAKAWLECSRGAYGRADALNAERIEAAIADDDRVARFVGWARRVCLTAQLVGRSVSEVELSRASTVMAWLDGERPEDVATELIERQNEHEHDFARGDDGDDGGTDE